MESMHMTAPGWQVHVMYCLHSLIRVTVPSHMLVLFWSCLLMHPACMPAHMQYNVMQVYDHCRRSGSILLC